MPYRSYRPDRRFKRRRWLLIIATLIAVVALIALLLSRQTEQRGTADFFAAADEAASLSGEAAAMVELTLSELGPLLERQAVTRSLAEISTKASEANDLMQIEVPALVANSYGTLVTATESWVKGTAELERVVLAVMDGKIERGAEIQMQTAMNLLSVGDAAYALFLESLIATPEEVDVPPFEVVTYIDPDPADPFLYDAQNLVLRITAAYNLAPRHNVSVVGMTDPEPVGDRDGIPVVPFAETIAIQAVVSNHGNEKESNVVVDLIVETVDSGEQITDTTTILVLEAGASTSIVFSELPIQPGGSYEATIEVRIMDDNDLSNNVWIMNFEWNDQS